jgi:EAL domain-containing protein (putative c-di-GMP-specific phosphodiesterase class I)
VDRRASERRRGQALTASLFAHRTRASVIAEGIEDVDMVDFVLDVDRRDGGPQIAIDGGQGSYLGRPGPAPAVRHPAAPNRSKQRRRHGP